MSRLDPRPIGAGALGWLDAYASQFDPGDDMALALVAAFAAERLSGGEGRARRFAKGLPATDQQPLETQATLARLGLAPAPQLPAPVAPPSILDILSVAPDGLPALLEAVERAFAPPGGPPAAGLAEGITGVGLECLAAYDLDLGCRLLRAAAYAGAGDSPGQRWGAEFLARQQRPDGSFGFIATDLLDGVDPDDPRLISAYRLPVTASCLWTLAELAVPGFRLFGTGCEGP